MAVQTSYTAAMAPAVAGMKANMEKSNVISRVAEGVLGFGVVACRGSVDAACRAIAAGTFDAVGAPRAGNTGNGAMTLGTPKYNTGVIPGVYVVTIVEPGANAGTFTVEDPNGATVGSGTVAVLFDGPVRFTIADGATDFVAGDSFTVTVTELAGGIHVLGISMKNEVQPAAASNPDQYNDTDIVPIMTEGVIWVLNGSGGAVLQGDAAYVVPATGAITNVGTGGNVRIPDAEFDSSGANGALVKLRLK